MPGASGAAIEVQAVPANGTPGDSAGKVQEAPKSKFSFPAFRSSAWKTLSLFLHVAIYFVVGIVGFKQGEEEEGWTYTDGLYFTMMTVSTVGYGDISPSNSGMRVFTLFMIFWGIIFIFPAIAAFIAPFSGPLQDRLQDWLEEKFPAKKVDIDGDGDADYSIPRSPAIFYFKHLFPSLLFNLTLQLVFAGIFIAIEENWDYFDAVYHCFVTGTTVGYGDQTIETQGGRLWASAHMAVSVCLLGEMISRIDDARAKRKAELARVEQLRKRLDEHLLERLVLKAKELRPQIEHTGGLTELEFVLCMVLELGMVELSQLRPFIKQFRQLDVSGCGSLDAHDLELTRKFSPAQLAAMRSAAGPSHGPSASAVAPAPEEAPSLRQVADPELGEPRAMPST